MRELHTLEVDKWEPGSRPGTVKHAGMISPQDAFDQLKKHLESVGLLPEEYFHGNDSCWKENGFERELPDYLQAECFVNWGGSEGIYLDICLLFRDENRRLERLPFATGKTLGASGDDFLRMSRIAAECSMMLNGRGAVVRFREEEKQFAPVVVEEKPSLDAAILEARNRQASALTDVAGFLDKVKGDDAVAFSKRFGLQPEAIRSDGAFLARVSSEVERLGAEHPGLLREGKEYLIQTALHNVCLSHRERLQQQRMAELKNMKDQRQENCL